MIIRFLFYALMGYILYSLFKLILFIMNTDRRPRDVREENAGARPGAGTRLRQGGRDANATIELKKDEYHVE